MWERDRRYPMLPCRPELREFRLPTGLQLHDDGKDLSAGMLPEHWVRRIRAA
jgi:hypothetical protein